ncbi:Hypothetical protein A7982_02297 [Minicystis rosea]|nr:Hypothetical protein A7982_02297 [Minicystis rosea]
MLGLGLVAWRRRQRSRPPSKAFALALALSALTGVYAYHAQPRGEHIGYWDIYHHYLGAKYAPELGYDKLYGATLAADDDGPRMFASLDRVRDLRTQRYLPPRALLARRDHFTSGFTPARWAAFRRDVEWFQAHIDRNVWPLVLTDRGYHPTPSWDRLAGLIASRVPLDAPGAMLALVLPDQLLLLAACAALLWAYGPITLGLFLVAWGANPLHLTPLKGAFLRMDWLAALLVSIAAYRRRRHALAGACLGYAALMRVFPVVFLGGVLVRAAVSLFATRRLAPRDARFLGAFAATSVVLFAFGGGLDRWHDFAVTIGLHAHVVSQQRSGLEYLVGLDRPLLYWPAAALMAVGFILAARRMTRPRLLPAGLVLMFTFVSAASYYYVVACLLVLCFHRRGTTADTWGLSALYAAFAIFAVAAIVHGSALAGSLSFLWSLLLLGLSLVLLWSAMPSRTLET